MTSSPRPSPFAAARRLGLLNVFFMSLAVLGVAAWLTSVWQHRLDPAFWQRDWYVGWSAARGFLDAGTEGLYSTDFSTGYFWLYPPYTLYAWVPVALLAPAVAYGLLMTIVIGATAAALILLRRSLPADGRFDTFALAVFASSAFISVFVMAQNSALILLLVAGALWALKQDREILAGLLIGLLGFKPNWVLGFVLWLAVTRRWRTLGTTAGVGALMLASTFPMGWGVWDAFLTSSEGWRAVVMTTDAYPLNKLITTHAFFQSVLGLDSTAGHWVWLLTEAAILVACLRVWLRRDSVAQQVAVTVLAAVSANIYTNFYDSLVLAVPAAVWWMSRSRYKAGAWKGIGVVICAAWLLLWISIYTPLWPGQHSLVGACVLAWLMLEATVAGRGALLAEPDPGYTFAGPDHGGRSSVG
ncbi:MAG: glycosyltransferase family 87 protein [Gemmatimonadota bacterium]